MSVESDIQTGSQIHIEVVKQPTNAAAAKTLARLLSKDENAVAENRRHKKIRKNAQWKSSRGGRWRVWESRMIKQHPVTGQLGESGTITATYDVLKDLDSVQRFVEVKAA
jgi:hypothetical protein